MNHIQNSGKKSAAEQIAKLRGLNSDSALGGIGKKTELVREKKLSVCAGRMGKGRDGKQSAKKLPDFTKEI